MTPEQRLWERRDYILKAQSNGMTLEEIAVDLHVSLFHLRKYFQLPVLVAHGTRGAYRWGCRCDRCHTAMLKTNRNGFVKMANSEHTNSLTFMD